MDTAIDAEIIIPLGDFERELVLKPKPEALKTAGRDPTRLESACRRELAIQQIRGKVDPTQIVIGEDYLGPSRSLLLTDLAEVRVQPLTFVPSEELKDLVARLTARDGRIAQQSSLDLARLGGRAKNIVPLLLTRLRDEREYVGFSRVIFALGYLGPHAAAAIPTLEEKMKLAVPPDPDADEDEFVRRTDIKNNAAEALGKIGTPAVPTLERALREGKDEWTRRYAANALARISPAGTSSLRTMLRELDGGMRVAAAEALHYSKDEQNIPALLPLLQDIEPAVRQAASQSLAEHGSAARAAIPALFKMLDEPIPECKASALLALGRIRCDAEQILPRLKEFLEAAPEDPASIHLTALEAAREFGHEASPLVPQIAACLERDERQTVAALKVLEAIGGEKAAVAAPRVAALASREQRSIWLEALKALFAMGPDAAGQAQNLGALLHRDLIDIDLEAHVIQVLGAIGVTAKETLPDVVPTLKSYGSAGGTPFGKVRAMAAIDIHEAIASVERNLKERELIGDGFRVQDRRRESLELLQKIKVDAEFVAAVMSVNRNTRLGQELDWSRITRWARVLRPGDSIDRIVAALGTPESAGLDLLEYRLQPDEKVEGNAMTRLRVRIEDGRLNSIEWEK
jgi:hypothetical protein